MLLFSNLVVAMYSADEKLVSRTLAGDRDAFGVLVHKYQEMVYTYAFQKARNEADAQDISQEIFLQAYRRLCQLRHPHLFRSWLYTIISNECKCCMERVMIQVINACPLGVVYVLCTSSFESLIIVTRVSVLTQFWALLFKVNPRR